MILEWSCGRWSRLASAGPAASSRDELARLREVDDLVIENDADPQRARVRERAALHGKVFSGVKPFTPPRAAAKAS